MNPLLVVLLPWLASPLAYLLRRWGWLAALAAIAGLSAGLWPTLGGGLPRAGAILGRPLVLTPFSAHTVLLLFLMAGLLVLASWILRQDWTLPAVILALSGLLAASVMMNVLILAVLLLQLAALLTVFLLQPARGGAISSAVHFFTVVLLAIPPLLLGAKILELYALAPESPAQLRASTLLLGVGFGLLLAVIPFHIWLPSLCNYAPALGSAAVLCLIQPTAVLLLTASLIRFPELLADPAARGLLLTGGALSALGGAFLALPLRRLGRLLAYGAISSMGAVLLGLGSDTDLGRAGALFQAGSHALALLLVATSLAVLRRALPSDEVSELAGSLRSLPAASLGLLVGGASLAGLPGTSGFVGRWLIYRALYTADPGLVALLLCSSALFALSVLRVQLACAEPSLRGPLPREPRPMALLLGGLALLILLLGIFPGPALGRLAEAGAALQSLP